MGPAAGPAAAEGRGPAWGTERDAAAGGGEGEGAVVRSGDSRLTGPEAAAGLAGGARRRGGFPRDADDTVLPALGDLSLGGGGGGVQRRRGGSRGSMESLEPGHRRNLSSPSVGGGGGGEAHSSVMSSPGLGGGGGGEASLGGPGSRSASLAGSGAAGRAAGGAPDVEVESPTPFTPRLKTLVQDGEETRLRVLRPRSVGTLAELLAELGAAPGSHDALQYLLPDAAAGEPEQWVTVKDDADVANMFAEFELAAAEAGGASRRFGIRLGSGTGSAGRGSPYSSTSGGNAGGEEAAERAGQQSAGAGVSMGGLVVIPPEQLRRVKRLGEGACGEVFQEHWADGGIPVAVKYFHQATPADFVKEARMLVELRHTHIVNVLGYTPAQELRPPGLVMEYMAGGTLRHAMARRELSARRRVSLARDAATGMQYLHSRSIAHLDLKPDNLLLGQDLRCKVTDFGLSQRKREGKSYVSGGGMIGTVAYMAPELLDASAARYGQPADVYSFGIILWELWTGELPYRELLDRPGGGMALLSQRALDPSTTPSLDVAVAPPCDGWRTLVSDCLQSDPAARPGFPEVVHTLKTFLAEFREKAEREKGVGGPGPGQGLAAAG